MGPGSAQRLAHDLCAARFLSIGVLRRIRCCACSARPSAHILRLEQAVPMHHHRDRDHVGIAPIDQPVRVDDELSNVLTRRLWHDPAAIGKLGKARALVEDALEPGHGRLRPVAGDERHCLIELGVRVLGPDDPHSEYFSRMRRTTSSCGTTWPAAIWASETARSRSSSISSIRLS